MIVYGNRILPDVGKCLVDDKGSFLLSAPVNSQVSEQDIDNENIQKVKGNVFIVDNKFVVNLSDEIKKILVNSLFSNDDQIAIMLNYQSHKTVEHKEIYNFMQDWRDWFSTLIKNIRQCYE